jgi:DNA-binding CsgD family transcriptional regulator
VSVQTPQRLDTTVVVRARADVAATLLPVDPRASRLIAASIAAASAGTGLLLVDLGLNPVYMNHAAAQILQYPHVGLGDANAVMQERIRSMLAGSPPALSVLSGRRRYTCQPFLLDPSDMDGRATMLGIVMERRPRPPIELAEMCRRFRLSPRERETVEHLLTGLTNREVAQRMHVSPNTVKQFVRLIMTKMGVATRSGIVGKITSR